MGFTGQSVTLANSIIGVGILAMPFCFQQCGVLLAVLMLLLSGLVSRLACYFLLKSAIIARKRNFEFLAFHVFGASGKLTVEIAIIGFLMGTCIAYFVVVGDLGPQIISKMFNINQSDVLRTCVMVLVSLVCVLPLGLLRNVDSLSNVSAATIGFYFCLIIKVIGEATSQLFAGDWWNKIELWKPEGVLQCVPIFSMALFCQTQLFEIFEAFPMLSLDKMTVVTKNALNICTVVYLMVGSFGYIAFCGQHVSGNILLSLSPTMTSDIIKLGFVMSLAFSFPLIIFPCRASLYSLMYRKALPSHHDHIINHSIPSSTFRGITVGIIAISLVVSLMIPNIELVLGLVGSTIGVMICVIFPAACFINVTMKDTNERLLAKIVLCLGFIIMILGTYANLKAADNNVERYDDRHITQEKIDKLVQDFMESNRKKFNSEEISQHQILPPKENDRFKEDTLDSAAQPPNPIAPDQKQPDNKVNIENIPKLGKPDIKDNIAQNEIEGGGDRETVINVERKKEPLTNIVKPEPEKVLKPEIGKVVDKSAVDSANNQDNLKIMKQKQLIETIKQHGEEQKELIKEQKEILDELKKTKLELEMKKKENMKEQMNKLAVESIQKIADIAIQSLSGADANEIKSSNIVAGPDNKSLPDDASKILQQAVMNIEKIAHKTEPKPSVEENNKEAHNSTNEQHSLHHEPSIPKEIGNDYNRKDEIKPNNLKIDSKIINDHVHSPDEPKSYMQGENQEKIKQRETENKLSASKMEALLNNVPVPLVMSQKYDINEISKQDNDALSKIKPKDPDVKPVNNEIKESLHLREKRDLEDREKENYTNEHVKKTCTDKDKLLDNIDIKIPQKLSVPEEIKLENVDMAAINKVNIVHYSRSLKSLQNMETKSR